LNGVLGYFCGGLDAAAVSQAVVFKSDPKVKTESGRVLTSYPIGSRLPLTLPNILIPLGGGVDPLLNSFLFLVK
jgi:hypothetical protein